VRSQWVEPLCRAAYRAGLVGAAIRLTEPRRPGARNARYQVLVYHRVGPVSDPFVFAVPPAVLEAHVRFLRRHFSLMSLNDLLAAAAQREVPARALAVTFDDGYEDLYTHAYPILARHRVPATVYLTTGLIDGDNGMWNDRVGAAIRDTAASVFDAVPGCPPLPLQTPAQRREALARVLGVLKPYPPQKREELVAEVERALGVSRGNMPRLLRWRQIAEMSAAGFDFGAHTMNHPILSSLPAAEAEREIAEPKRVIEERLQRPVVHFAYPNGRREDFTEETKRLVRAAGFASAVTTIFDTNTADTDPYELRRCGPLSPSPEVFVTKLWWHRQRLTG
jgi:peptidoglycan/xylan/chitin deacetylase (PgdA/CDA1 family)